MDGYAALRLFESLIDYRRPELALTWLAAFDPLLTNKHVDTFDLG